ncbi:MAG: hypothetical protein Q8Q23_05885 [bacterium]|nr:hypothetical protein [bacterium]
MKNIFKQLKSKIIVVFVIFAFIFSFSLSHPPLFGFGEAGAQEIIDPAPADDETAETADDTTEPAVTTEVPPAEEAEESWPAVTEETTVIETDQAETAGEPETATTTDENIATEDGAATTTLSAPEVDISQATTTPSDVSQATTTPEEVLSAAEESVDVVSNSSSDATVPATFTRGLHIISPSIIAQWQMSIDISDDDTQRGAQFLPSAQYQVDTRVTVCALVADTSGAENISGVTAAVFYPDDAALTNASSTRPMCGQQKAALSLEKMPAGESAAVLCDNIRNNNNSLITWGKSPDGPEYGYENVCGSEGFLQKQKAAVFCAEMPLAYNDPAGIYHLSVAAANSGGIKNTSAGDFQYLRLTSFEHDFTAIQYGQISENELKVLAGDTVWSGASAPTVRNTGNTNLQIKISQNDFGLGKTGMEWNISYQARVGADAPVTLYLPYETAILNNLLGLGELAGVDFGALIKQFPASSDAVYFAGELTLTADYAPFAVCAQ